MERVNKIIQKDKLFFNLYQRMIQIISLNNLSGLISLTFPSMKIRYEILSMASIYWIGQLTSSY